MKNKSMIGLQSRNILLIFGTTVVALLVSTSSQMQMVSASVEGGAPVSNASKSNQSAAVAGPYEGHCIPGQPCLEQSQGGSQGVSPGSNTSNFNQGAAEGCTPMDPRCGPQDQPNSSGASNPNQEAINHINQAQSSLQNGDTQGAQMHMDLAKTALINCAFNPGAPQCH